jgi:diguanylate cyclase (GGDEF)-like protein
VSFDGRDRAISKKKMRGSIANQNERVQPSPLQLIQGKATLGARDEFPKDQDEDRRFFQDHKSTAKPFDILIVDDDADIRALLECMAEREGMCARAVQSNADAIRAIEERFPDGLIIDIGLPDGTGYDLVKYVRSLPQGGRPAVVVISVRAGFLDKVEAVHCGADGYFEKPLDWESLLGRFRKLLERTRQHTPRVLSMEDDPDQAAYVRAILEAGGYEVHICSDPKKFETDLVTLRPDLVLMDIMLPNVTGYDLVKCIRQDEAHALLPILFLTTEEHDHIKIQAVRSGGDDYLLKPVQPGLLLSTVAARIERAGFLKSLVDRDGLTHLLTHSAFFQRAQGVVSLNCRNPLRSAAMIMLDLDCFKSVNDRFGHLVGDRVLTSLSALLRRRLRQSDIIGRYGGEEFVVIVEDLRMEEALRLSRRLLEEFSAIKHTATDSSVFSVSFSAGIAMFENGKMDLESWKKAADDALYAAKAAGRNCVRAANE